MKERYAKWGFPQEAIRIKPSFRIVDLYASEEQILASLKDFKPQKNNLCPKAYTFSLGNSIASSNAYLLGHIFVQDIASICAGFVLNPAKQDRVLDMCAAPGGKTTHLAQLMQNQGEIIAVDNNPARLQKLEFNLERLRIKNVQTLISDARQLAHLGLFDKVLLDAPCSGNFAIDSHWFSKRKLADFEQRSRLQKDLLQSGVSYVKKGGELLYLTCSLEKEENEDVVEWALDHLPVKLVDIDLDVEKGLTQKTRKCRRFWPSKTKTQGFFLAKFTVL